MAERLEHQEQAASHEQVVSHEQHRKLEHDKQIQAEKAKAETSPDKLEELRETVSETAKHSNETSVSNPAETDVHSHATQRELKDEAYRRLMGQVRRHLKRPTRSFSKLVHSPVVDSISNVSAKTIARPSGLLGGSIFAFLGSVVLLYSAKHYGFKYNYSFFFVCFVAGFLVGAFIELLLWFTWSKRRRNLA